MAPPPNKTQISPSLPLPQDPLSSSSSSLTSKPSSWTISISPGGFTSLSSTLSSNLGIGGPYSGHSTFTNAFQYGLGASGLYFFS